MFDWNFTSIGRSCTSTKNNSNQVPRLTFSTLNYHVSDCGHQRKAPFHLSERCRQMSTMSNEETSLLTIFFTELQSCTIRASCHRTPPQQQRQACTKASKEATWDVRPREEKGGRVAGSDCRVEAGSSLSGWHGDGSWRGEWLAGC